MLDLGPTVSDADRNRTAGHRGDAGQAAPTPAQPATAPTTASLDFLNELDLPSAPGASRVVAEPTPERTRSTLEFLTALDVPTRPTTGDSALVGDTLSEANAPAFAVADPSPETERAVDSVRAPAQDGEQDGTEAARAAHITTRGDERAAAGPVDADAHTAIAPSRFSWEQDDAAGRTDDATHASPGADPKPRFSWEPAAPATSGDAARDAEEPRRFSWEGETSTAARATPDPRAADVLAPEPAPAPRVLRAPRPAPKPVEEAIEERRQRLAVRVHTCRDAFRLLGFLGIPDDARSATAQLLIAVEDKLTAGSGAKREDNALKSPERFLSDAPREKLDQVERVLVAVEDKLLLLDDLVPPTAFRSRIEGRDHSRTVLARYARLLASRHFPAGQRRDRFEWLATRLLTTREADGHLAMLPKDRARVVLQHLIGGMPDRAAPDEEAIAHLQDAITKLDEIQSAQEFFDSGFYLDNHGYKVSMRDQLLAPDFLYLSVAFGAKVENRLEEWIRGVDGHQPGQERSATSNAREGIRRLLEEQERAVDEIFGAMRGSAQPAEVVERKPPPKKAAPEPETSLADRIAERIPIRIAMDRQTAAVGALAVVILGVLAWVLITTRTVDVGQATSVPLTTEELQAYSPMLLRGYLVTSGDDRTLQASIRDTAWATLSKEARFGAANSLTRNLRDRGVLNGRITNYGSQTPVIEITRGELIRVATEP